MTMTLEQTREITSTMTHEQAREVWEKYYDEQRAIQLSRYQWFKGRIKLLGYKSITQFTKETNQTVTAGTISNYFRGHSTMPIWQIARLSYGLKMTPNDLLTVMGYYDPEKQTIA